MRDMILLVTLVAVTIGGIGFLVNMREENPEYLSYKDVQAREARQVEGRATVAEENQQLAAERARLANREPLIAPRPDETEVVQAAVPQIQVNNVVIYGDPANHEPLIAPKPHVLEAIAAQANGTETPGEAVAGGDTGEETEPEVREVKLLIPEREFEVEGPKNALRVGFDDLDLLKVLNMEPVTPDAPELLPDWLAGLNGKTIRIRGFMKPTFQATGLRHFVLARDTQICCFGRYPKVYDLIKIFLEPGQTTDYLHLTAFDVVGELHIEPFINKGKLIDLYTIRNARIITKRKSLL